MTVFINHASQTLTEQAIEAILAAGNTPAFTYNNTLNWHDLMSYRINLLLKCDALYIINDPELTVNGRIERFIAEQLGKRIIFHNSCKADFERIFAAILKKTGVTKEQMKSKSRTRLIVQCRQVFSKIARDKGISITKIGDALNRDHSCIVYYLHRFDDDFTIYQVFRKSYNEIISNI